jgi:hypothetical protein
MIVDNKVSPALQAIFYKFFNGRKFLFRQLGYIFAQGHAVLFKIGIEIRCLVILPLELFILYLFFPNSTVLTWAWITLARVSAINTIPVNLPVFNNRFRGKRIFYL